MDYGREKGFQDGDFCRKTGGHSSGRFCLLATLLTASFGISLLALVLATSANLQVRGRGEGWADWIEEAEQARDIPDIDTMELQNNPVEQEAVHVVGGGTERHSVEERSSTAGRGESLDALCNSDISPNTTERPSAHIVPAGAPNCLIKRPNGTGVFEVIISKGWNCGNPYALVRSGHVRGGMKFNRTMGYLTLPVDGIYYIYSQVQFSSNTAENNNAMAYGTLVYTPGHPKLKRSVRYLESFGRPFAGPRVKATFNHGGLFHLPAGAQIHIAAKYDTRAIKPKESLWFSGFWEDSFMGAFLVDEVPFQ